jgi:rRNA processing protein Gar1
LGSRRKARGLVLGVVRRIHGGRILVEAKMIPALTAKVYDGRNREVGYVSNILGPAGSPYIVVKLTSEKSVDVGEELYVVDRT